MLNFPWMAIAGVGLLRICVKSAATSASYRDSAFTQIFFAHLKERM
jgi:hypothetical protein